MKTRITAILTAAVMLLGTIAFTSCADTKSAMTLDGEQVRAGEYIYAQIQAVLEAEARFAELNPDTDVSADGFSFFRQTVDGKSFTDWVNDRTVERLKERKAAVLIFGEMGLSLSRDDEILVRDTVEAHWSGSEGLGQITGAYGTWGDFYERVGVGKESFTAVLTANLKLEQVFNAIFGVGGIEEVPMEDVRELLVRDYARFRRIEIPPSESEEQNAEYERLLNEYAERLNEGESFAVIYNEFEAYLNALHSGESELDPENGGDELDPENGGDELDPENGENELEPENGENGLEPENGENELEPEIEAEETENPDEQYDVIERRENAYYIPPDAGALLFSMEPGTAAVIRSQDFDAFYLLQRLDILENEDMLEDETTVNSLIADIKGDEMDERIKERAVSITAVLNDAAVRRYNPENTIRRGQTA